MSVTERTRPLVDGKKLTLRLGSEAVADLEWIAKQLGGITLTEVIRRAVATQKYLLDQQELGDVIVLENKRTGRQRELALI